MTKQTGLGAYSRSRASTEPASRLGPSGFDRERDGIDVAIAAFFAARVFGGTIEEATRRAKDILELFGIEPETTP